MSPLLSRTSLIVACLSLLIAAGGLPAPSASTAETASTKRLLRVGPGQQLRTPGEAAAVARSGDVIEIEAGVYPGDVAVWRQDRLTIRGVDGRAHLRADGNHAEGKAIWVIKGNNTTVQNIEFSGATVPDRNGAGIRQEGRNLTVRNCYFHDNENGILAGDHPRSKIIVEHSIFENNGYGEGRTHNIYINGIRRFVFRYNWTHHTRIGHNVKTRAKRSYILYNRIMDGDDGTSSYAVDLSNGGLVVMVGNVIQQGPETDNSTIVAFGAEGLTHRRNKLFFIHNTVVNDRHAGTFLWITGGEPDKVKVVNNLFVGPGDIDRDPDFKIRRNLFSRDDPGFVDADAFDYRLAAGSRAIDAGGPSGSAGKFSLRPRFHYLHPADREQRNIERKPDLGAYERE
ncbi:MAG: right-handed parallel beta-helix repeat-containing protein [Acidobacteriota bacterium]